MRHTTQLCRVLSIGLIIAMHSWCMGADDQSQAITEADNGKTITVTTNRVTIKLAGNITTGYSWATKKIEGQGIRQIGEPDYQRGDGGRVGSGGAFLFTFEVANPAKATIELEYRRPWEKDQPPAKVFTVTMDRQPAPPATAPATKPAAE